MNIPFQHQQFVLFAPMALMIILCISMAFSAPEINKQPEEIEYNAWTIRVNDYADVDLDWNNRIFCGEWRVPIREHLSDTYCILRSGQQLLPISWTTSSDSLIYEEFMDSVIDTMRIIAIQENYVREEDKTWW